MKFTGPQPTGEKPSGYQKLPNEVLKKKLVTIDDLPECSENHSFFGIIGCSGSMSDFTLK